MKIGQTTFIYSFTKVVAYIIGFIATIYYARVVGEEVLGVYFLALAVVSWVGVGARLGVSNAVKKRVSEGNEPNAFFTAGGISVGVILIMISTGLYIFREYIEGYIGESVLILLLILVMGNLLYNFGGASLQGRQLVHMYALLSLIKRISRNILQILLVFLGFGLSGLLFGYAIGWLIAGTLALTILGLRPKKPSLSHFRSLFDYAKYAWLGSVRGRSFRWVDITVLGVFVSSGQVGIYSIAWTVAAFLQFFSDAIRTTIFPEISSKSEVSGVESVANLVNVSLSYASLIIVPGFIGAILIGDRVLQLYGEAFVQGQAVFVILIGGVLIYSYQKQFLTALGAIDRPDLEFRVNSAFILSNVLLNFVLIWQIGLIGAAIATGLSSIIGGIYSFYYIRKLVPITIPSTIITKQWLAGGIMGLSVYLFRASAESTVLSSQNEIFVIILVSAGAMIYFLSLFLISSEFREVIKSNVPSRYHIR